MSSRLHFQAGSKPVELHGTTHEVICLECGDVTDRHLFQNRVKRMNPEVCFWALSLLCCNQYSQEHGCTRPARVTIFLMVPIIESVWSWIIVIYICSLVLPFIRRCLFVPLHMWTLQWAQAVESLETGHPGSDSSFGMKMRPDGDLEIDEKFFRKENFHIPACKKCSGVLKPDVSHYWHNHFKRVLQDQTWWQKT